MAVERMSPRCLRLALPLGALLWLLICGCWARVRADDACPEGQAKYDIELGEYVYRAEDPEGNDFDVDVEGQGSISWQVKRGCYINCVCIADEGLHWLPWANEGSWDGGDHAVFWGGAQVPEPMPEQCVVGQANPPRAYLPLVMKGDGVRISE